MGLVLHVKQEVVEGVLVAEGYRPRRQLLD
jgi:hypothetical protein